MDKKRPWFLNGGLSVDGSIVNYLKTERYCFGLNDVTNEWYKPSAKLKFARSSVGKQSQLYIYIYVYVTHLLENNHGAKETTWNWNSPEQRQQRDKN